MRPNIVLVVLDTARADVFEPYGAPAGSSPTVADLAARGSALTAYSPANWTVPAHASMFTGLLPRDLGLTQVAGGDRSRCRAPLADTADRNLVRRLQQAGWRTRGVSANPWVSGESGFDVGFDDFALVTSGRASMVDPSLRGRAAWLAEAVRARADHGARAVASVVRRWATELDGSQPFFWFVNLLECHSPYLPPARHNPLGAWQRVRAADEARRYLTLESMFRVCAGNLQVPETALARMRQLYAGAVRLCDEWVAELLDVLSDVGVLDDTQVIVTSDHGENLGDDGLIGHAFSLDERLLRVPFVTAGPLSMPADAVLGLAELPAVLGSALDLKDAPWQRGDPGVVVAQHDGVGAPDSPELRAARDDWGLDDDGVRRLSRPLTVSTDGRWKLVSDGTDPVAYDVLTDPLERRPLPVEDVPADVRARLTAALAAARQPAASPPAPAPAAVEEDTSALEEQMRMLGYL